MYFKTISVISMIEALDELTCLECGMPLEKRRFMRDSVVTCICCGNRFTLSESNALTYVDEIPHGEYLGG